uniref:Uncharacterized protein n=1 Tax=Leptobrachium leishanense TaxID=445787 RepID=A0A8C5QCD1_9ANUR
MSQQSSKKTLEQLCRDRNISTKDEKNEELLQALEDYEARQAVQDAAEQGATLDPAEGSASPVERTVSSASPKGDTALDVYLQTVLKHVDSADSQTRLQLILKYQEREERRAEREAAERRRQAERAHQLALAQASRTQLSPAPAGAAELSTPRPRAENFPTLDKDGDLDVFLRSFEKTCRQYQLPKEQWARYLTPGLKGPALEAFAELPAESDQDYEAIKAVLQRHYNLTPEVYRKKFRSLQKRAAESYSAVVNRRAVQAVIVGTQVSVCLRDTAAEVTLVRPGFISPTDFIPGKTLAVKGFGGVRPAVPMVWVYLDWRAGRGLREEGVSENIPTDVLLGTDLGKLVSQYVLERDAGDLPRPTSGSMVGRAVCGDAQQDSWTGGQGMAVSQSAPAPGVPEVLCGSMRGQCDWEERQGVSECPPAPVSAGSPDPMRGEAAVPMVEVGTRCTGASESVPCCECSMSDPLPPVWERWGRMVESPKACMGQCVMRLREGMHALVGKVHGYLCVPHSVIAPATGAGARYLLANPC